MFYLLTYLLTYLLGNICSALEPEQQSLMHTTHCHVEEPHSHSKCKQWDSQNMVTLTANSVQSFNRPS